MILTPESLAHCLIPIAQCLLSLPLTPTLGRLQHTCSTIFKPKPLTRELTPSALRHRESHSRIGLHKNHRGSPPHN